MLRETVTVVRMASSGGKGGREVSHLVRCISEQDGSVCPLTILSTLLSAAGAALGRVYYGAPLPSSFWLTLANCGPRSQTRGDRRVRLGYLVSPLCPLVPVGQLHATLKGTAQGWGTSSPS